MLKYLFKVEYTDGSVYKQNKEDVSEQDPKRSCFYDVLNSSKEVKTFSLGRMFDWWTVNLKTGEFIHNGIKFQLEWNIKPAKRELIFQRQHEQDSTATYRISTGEVLGVKDGKKRTKYFLGYKSGKQEYIVGIK